MVIRWRRPFADARDLAPTVGASPEIDPLLLELLGAARLGLHPLR